MQFSEFIFPPNLPFGERAFVSAFFHRCWVSSVLTPEFCLARDSKVSMGETRLGGAVVVTTVLSGRSGWSAGWPSGIAGCGREAGGTFRDSALNAPNEPVLWSRAPPWPPPPPESVKLRCRISTMERERRRSADSGPVSSVALPPAATEGQADVGWPALVPGVTQRLVEQAPEALPHEEIHEKVGGGIHHDQQVCTQPPNSREYIHQFSLWKDLTPSSRRSGVWHRMKITIIVHMTKVRFWSLGCAFTFMSCRWCFIFRSSITKLTFITSRMTRGRNRTSSV